MKLISLRSRIIASLVVLACAPGCSDATLCLIEPGTAASCDPGPEPRPDNIIEVEGTACTADPDFLIFPHKVMFVLDRSGSNTISDPSAQRADAAINAVSQYVENRAISFAVVGFNSEPEEVTSGFTRDVGMLTAAIDSLRAPQGGTEYLATLDLAYDIITRDAETTTQAERGRTTYEILWLSDGIPDPCQDLGAIEGKVDAIMELKAEFGFFNLELHTTQLVYGTPGKVCADGSPAEYLAAMAERGDGTFAQLSSDQLEFEIHFTEVRRSFTVRDFFLVNENRVVWDNMLFADSDGDGIRDANVDFDLDPLESDFNADGCSDRVDMVLLPNDRDICGGACRDDMKANDPATLPDQDGDGIPDCAELMLGTDVYDSDSDHDGFPDPLEIRFGTNPLDDRTVGADGDWDGFASDDEIRSGLNPLVAESSREFAYVYSQGQEEMTAQGTRCFDFHIANVQLVETLRTRENRAGDNLLCLYVVQTPHDDPGSVPLVTRACKKGSYLAELDLKEPADGVLSFEPADFEVVFERHSTMSASSY